MTLSFHIEYRTSWGEEIRVLGSVPELGDNRPEKALPLHTVDGIHWTSEAEISQPDAKEIHYSYHVYRDGQPVRSEWNGLPRTLYTSGNPVRAYRLEDCWKDIPEEAYFYTSAFTESFLAHPDRDAAPTSHSRSLIIKAYAPCIDSGHCLAVCGSAEALGGWDTAKAVRMSDANFPEWQAEIDAAGLTFPLEYKFVLYDKAEGRVVAWEDNPNRRQADPQLAAGEALVVGDRHVRFSLPAWKGAGTAIPVFSLRSEGSFGVGDFGDLRKMIDWAALTRQKVVQILPVNDTTMTHAWTDSYPYSSISIYALHPMYADLRQLPPLDDRAKTEQFERRRRELNALPVLDYEAVNKAKWEYLRLLFAREGEKVLASDGFRAFFEANEEWLKPYAVFSYLRDAYRTPDFRRWPRYADCRPEDIDALSRPGTADYPHVALHYYVQYQLHRQLLAAGRHARARGVVLKGDIPIGISRHSVEAWKEPHYFNLDGQAGAPPDSFSAQGQNWGFPTYNWDVMERDGYAWWMKRFRKMAEYFDAYRIDHILGFFRIWEIPAHAVHGLMGQFVPALPMTPEEIESYGLPFRPGYLRPYIRESVLGQVFGPLADHVRQTFLEPDGEPEAWRMRPDFDTQRKVEAHFAGRTDDDSLRLRDGLYALLSDVLFLPDRNDPATCHPRIAARHTYAYHALAPHEQAAFDRLYEHYYYHRHNDFWAAQAMKKLPRLTQSAPMLACGEDLGMIPACVPHVMERLHILSLEIQRMPKDPAREFGDPARAPYPSVSATSTHDTSTLRGWWEEDPARTQRYYNHVLGRPGTAPATATPDVCKEILRAHLAGSSLLCIPPLQDWLALDGHLRHPRPADERINIPDAPRHYWRYRMHLTLEQLLAADGLNGKIRQLIAQGGR